MGHFNYRGREPRPHRVEIRLTEAELERLNQICAELELNASVIIRRALKLYVEGDGAASETAYPQRDIYSESDSEGYQDPD